MAMDAKDSRAEAALTERSNDGGAKFALQYDRSKSHDVGSSAFKGDTAGVRPCAVIGPDRVVPPSRDGPKKAPAEPWLAPDPVYRRLPDYPYKMPDHQDPTRNISPRQTFQENMQRIIMPPGYNSTKLHEDSPFASKNTKLNVPSEVKYCEVPYNINQVGSDQKHIRNTDHSASNVNPMLMRGVPHGWPTSSVHIRPLRTYGAPEVLPYADYANCTGPRPVLTRTHEEPLYPDPYYHESNIRFKPYPNIKERYPQSRYEYLGNYPSPYHPPNPYAHKYELPKTMPPHSYPGYPQVPKYTERIPEPLMDGYQRTLNQQGNYGVPMRNPVIHSSYRPVSGNHMQSKMNSYPPDGQHKPVPNKLPYDPTSKMYLDYETRSKVLPMPDNYYLNEVPRPYHPKNTIVVPNFASSNMHGVNAHPYYIKENMSLKNYEYPRYKNMDPNMINHSLTKLPAQFSPSTLAISPADSNASNETALTHGTSQEDCGYVSQSSVTSVRSIESLNRIPMDPYGRYDYRYGPIVRASPPTKPDPSSNQGSKSKKDIRQFISSWSEGDDENAENSAKRDGVKNVTDDKHAFNKQYESVNNQEQLYVLGLVNVPSEELSKYEHIQKVSKLPENIKGYNSLELLNQFEEAIESSNMASVKPPTPRTIQMPLKSVPHKHEPIPRPLSPLDVEAKISQSVIHKEVGCNFEIKPCSPKMLNVEVATPMQMLNERVIEKVANPHNVKSQSILQAVDENLDHTLGKQTMKCPIPNTTSSCKMINSQHLPNSPTIDHLKTSYTLHDLESNSGVCLASLPRLDTDIELNFPEVNQQFINANKTDSVITASFPKDLPTLDIERSAMATECDINYQYSPKTGTETDFSRLSKYRKLKRCVPDENDTASAKVQATRVDSVIIKNPDNTRSLEETNDNSGNGFKDDLQEFAMNLVSQTKHTKLQHDVDKMFDPSTNTDSYDDVKNKLPDTLIHQSNNLVNKQFSVNEESSSNNVIRPQTEDCNMHKDISNRYLEKAALDIPMNLSPQARHSLIEIDEEIRYTDKGGKTPVLEDKHRFVGGNIHGKENNASEVKCISSGHLDKPDDVLMNLQNDTSDEQRCNTYEKPLTIPNTHSNHLTTGLGKKCDLQKNDQDLTVLHVDNQISNSPKMEIESSVSYTKNQTSYSPKMETEMNNLVSHANHISSSPKIETETDSSISRDKTGNLFSPKTDTETDNATSHDKNQNSYSAKIKTETYNSVPHIQNHTFHITTVDSAIEKTSFFEDQQVALNEEGKVNLTSTINQTLSENKEEPKTLSIGEINQKNTLLSSHGENDILLKPYHKNHDSISYFPKLKRKKFRGEATHRKRNYQNKPLDIDDHVLKTGEKLNVLSIPDKKEPAEQLTHEKAQDIPETIIENEKNKTQIDSMSLITEFNKVDTDTDTEFNKDMPTATATNNDVIENISQNIPDDINNSVPVSSSPIEDKSFETIFKTETKELQNDLFLDIDNDTKKCNENSDSATNLNPDKLVVLNKNHKVNASDITSDLIEPAEFLTQENTNINIEANKFNMIERSYQDKSQSHDIDTLVSSVIKEKALEESRKDHLMHTDQSVEQGAELNVNTSFENENINITTNMLKKECQSNNLEIIKSNNEDNLMSEFKHDTQNNISPYETRTKNVLVCHEFVHKELFSSRFQNLLFYNVNFDTCPNNSEYNVTHELPTKNNNSYDHVASSPKTDEVNVNIDNKVSSEENIRELDSADRIETRNLADMAEKCFNVNLGVEIFDHTTDENKISSAQKDEYNINENHIPNDTESTMPSSEYDIKSFDTNRINIVADNEHLELHNVNASADSPVSKPVEEMAKSWENDLEEYNVKCVSDTHYTNEDCIQKSVDKIDYKFSGLDIDYESVNFQNDDDENANTVVDDSGYKSPYQEMDDECAKNLENNNDDSDLQLINNVESNVCDTNIILIENSISVTPEHCDDYNKIVRSVEDEFDKKIESFVEHISARPRFALKRSLSDSALNTYDDDVDECPQKRCVFPKKRKKICDITKIDESHLLNIIQSSRRNSVSTLSNENFSFCILIDDHCIVSEENCDENDMQFENNFLNHSLKDPEVGEKNASPAYKLEDQNENTSDTYINKYDEEKIWVEDVGCEETIETEDIAENIVIGEPGSPKDLTDYESDDEDMDTLSNEDANHTSKVKHIYGDNMCTNDAQLVDALYKTPQMDVNKKLMDKESHVTEKANSKYYDSDSLEMLLAEPVYNIPRTAPEPNVNLKIEKNENLDIEQRSGADSMNKENIDSKCLEDPSPLVSDIKNIMTIDALPKEDDIESKNNIMAPPADNCDDAQDGTIHSCESSLDNVFSYVDKRKSPHKSSSSPEVSSTTSEEKNSSILLKISNFKGSRVSEVKNLSSHLEEHNSCKHTTNEYFKPDYGHGTTSKRPLLTKAAQKYIPPLRESIPDLKVKLALPQQSLLKLQKNKVAKDEPKYNTRNIYSDKNHIKLKKEIPKKIKPKFEDVLKNIDEAQFQMQKAKNKKSKKYIPKVVIKKSENGSHYASTCTKEAFNPDLTGRKWQPWVFIEKNKFIDNMALRNKTRAVFSHRKKSFVLAEKFCKYRSISTAKFVISQPKVNEFSAGNLKYTIKLKHR
ncbi:uncharacterized protein LOC125225648 [Leguminivora glycinivorella]|uniref:uncharacterized protein LOC125225648 n=1 Tax=Leguminivora glycinivorella TaxID=1035111 RepID=UPI00201043B7|nr:uncharacterized protein LOC125225648 [Leguminivora glycinivorella]